MYTKSNFVQIYKPIHLGMAKAEGEDIYFFIILQLCFFVSQLLLSLAKNNAGVTVEHALQLVYAAKAKSKISYCLTYETNRSRTKREYY